MPATIRMPRLYRREGDATDGRPRGEPGDRTLCVARRDVLSHLERHGPDAVAELPRGGRMRPRHVRRVVDQLAEEGLVEYVGNPASRRWHLVRLTERGLRSLARRLSARTGSFSACG